MENKLKVASTFVYPLKSGRRVQMNLELSESGPKYDRILMAVLEKDGKYFTQRNNPRLARIQTQVLGNLIRLSARGYKSIKLDLDNAGEERFIQLKNYQQNAIDLGDEAAKWISKIARFPDLRLVRQNYANPRLVDPRYLNPELPNLNVNFVDNTQLHMISLDEVELLNGALVAQGSMPIDESRFRANINVYGSLLGINQVRIGQNLFNCIPTPRCVITSIDQKSGEKPEPKEPLATINRLFGSPNFGVYLVHAAEPTETIIRVGDDIEVIN